MREIEVNVSEARFVDNKAATETKQQGEVLPNFEETAPDTDLPF